MILGLDISTTCVGCSVLSLDDELVKIFYVDLSKQKTLFEKLDFFMKEFVIQCENLEISKIFVEAPMQSFNSTGFSTANTINKLGSFNFGLSYQIREHTNITPEFLFVQSARKMCGIKVPRDIDKTSKKTYVLEAISKYYSVDWALSRSGGYKKQCYDMADSLVIAKAGLCILKKDTRS